MLEPVVWGRTLREIREIRGQKEQFDERILGYGFHGFRGWFSEISRKNSKCPKLLRPNFADDSD